MNLNDREWKDFFISDVVEIVSGQDIYEAERTKGKTPYITATALKNGIGYFVGNSNPTLESNCLSVNRNGSVGYSFYHPYKALFSNDCRKLRPHNPSKYVGIFISQQISRQKDKYGYGYKMGTERLKKQMIMLPATSTGNPDYDFMEQYMRLKEQEKVKEFQIYITKRINELKSYEDTTPLSEKDWGEFEIGKLFKLVHGKSKGLTHLARTKKGVNYLGATNLNNGVLCQVERKKSLIQDGNGIAFIRNGEGSMGYSIYKAEKFIATSDISVGYNPKLNRYIGTFITTVADKVRGKYNFGYKRSGTRSAKEKIMLPINEKKTPDYEYMENYMKRLEYMKLTEYLERKNLLPS